MRRYRTEDLRNFVRTGTNVGSGSFGTVYHCRDDEKDIAVKITSDRRSYEREVNALLSLHHPNILALKGRGNYSDRQLALVYEFCSSGSLGTAIRNQVLTPEVVMRIAVGVARALTYAHTRNFLHGDLKPGNILLDDHFRPKVGDWGLAVLGNVAPSRGDPRFRDGQHVYTKKSDVYSYGIVLNLMRGACMGHLPQAYHRMEHDCMHPNPH
ncbi:hypothetical protein Agub_g9690, partial [Astrephomene gubernaculifera]